MKALLIILSSLALLQSGAQDAHREIARPTPVARLTGQFSGFNQADTRQVDLRIRFFRSRFANAMLAERYFGPVALVAGRFSVSLNPAGISAGPLYVEIGLRPSGRRYADFSTAGERQAVELEVAGPEQIWRLREPTDETGS